MKKIRWISLLLAILMLLAACNTGGSTVETTAPDTQPPTPELPPVSVAFADCQIVRSEYAQKKIKDCMSEVKKAVKDATGVSLSLKTDYLPKDEIPFEILIGKTERPESQTVLDTLESGEYAVQTVASENGVKIVLIGYTDELTVSAVNKFISRLSSGEAVNEDGVYQALSIHYNYYEEYKNFRMEISDPVVVMQAPEADQHWGHYQFPNIYYTTTGAIGVSWSYHDDTVYGGGGTQYAYSKDGGKTWQLGTNGTRVYDYTKTHRNESSCFVGFTGQASYVVEDWLNECTPIIKNAVGETDVYLAKDLSGYTFTPKAVVYNYTTGGSSSVPVTVNWPYMPITLYNNPDPEVKARNFLYTAESALAISGYMGVISTDNGLYYATYCRGINSKTGEVEKYSKYYSVYVFHSADEGMTWNYVSQLTMDDRVFAEVSATGSGVEGFCEPSLTVTPNGTVVMLMRTGGNNPCYIVQSTDGCQTWSDPVIFDECGVLPQLLTLDCGVTIASYGRPKLFVRASSDPNGVEWKRHKQIALAGGTGWNASCYYTYLLRIDATTAMMVYSDFQLKNEDGQPRKSILVRTIKIYPQ